MNLSEQKIILKYSNLRPNKKYRYQLFHTIGDKEKLAVYCGNSKQGCYCTKPIMIKIPS